MPTTGVRNSKAGGLASLSPPYGLAAVIGPGRRLFCHLPRVDGGTPAAPLSSRQKSLQKAAMPVRLDRSSADFDQRFAAFLAAKREGATDQ